MDWIDVAAAKHPLAHTFARASAMSARFKAEVGAPAGPGWIAAMEDFMPGALWMEQLIAHTQARFRTTAPVITASAILQGYQWPLIGAAIACYLLDRRAPALSMRNSRVHYTADFEADALALLDGRFAALPDDPAADHPDATVVADLDALRTALRTAIETHLGGVIDRLGVCCGCITRSLWLTAADACAGTLVWLMQECHPQIDMAQIEAEVNALIRVPGSPLYSRQTGLIRVTYQDDEEIFTDRATCCHWHRTKGGDYCSTCPKRTAADRTRRLMTYLAEKHARRAKAEVTT